MGLLSLAGRPLLAAIPFLASAAVALEAPERIHAPHDNVYDVACAPLAGGGVEIVIASSADEKVLRSTDRGLSWTTVTGDGLELVECFRVVYWPEPTAPRFILGTEKGVWFYYPGTGIVQNVSSGLGADDFVSAVAASPYGTGTPSLLTSNGGVYLWDEGTSQWNLSLSTGDSDDHGQLAVSPYFDPGSAVANELAMFAGVAGRLHQSTDGGATWTVHPQFSTVAAGATDWHITALTLHDDYLNNGIVVLGRGRENLGTQTGLEGEIWQSSNAGVNFGKALDVPSTVRALEATQATGGGVRQLFFATETYPDRNTGKGFIGLYRSVDGGVNWDDFGNYQDFFLERPDFTVAERFRKFVGFAVSPDYATDQMIYFGRPEGFYRSIDEGLSWRMVRLRSELYTRALDLALDANGDLIAFGATYGAGTLRVNVTTGVGEVLDEAKVSFQDSVAASPNYANDGMMASGGDKGIQFWFDPNKPVNNLYGAQGWFYDPEDPFGYVRTIEMDHEFDASNTLPNANQILFWSTRSDSDGVSFDPTRTFGTQDLGQSYYLLDELTNSGNAPFMQFMIIAPTFDPASAATRTDVFAASGAYLFVLDDVQWGPVHLFHDDIMAVEIDPDWSRPANPRFFVALASAPHLAEVIYDDAQNITINPINAPGLEKRLIMGLAVPPDYATRPMLYASTWGGGVYRLDMSAPTPTWEVVGTGYPPVFSEPIECSPNFATDRTLVVGTRDGIVVGEDAPGAPWTLTQTPGTVSLKDSGFNFRDPNANGNSQPQRAWPWTKLAQEWIKARYPSLSLIGAKIAFTQNDGASVEWDGYASTVHARTFRGPGIGTVTLEVYDFWSGALLDTVTEDLNSTPALEAYRLSLAVPGATLGSPLPVRIRMQTSLTQGEIFPITGLTVDR